MIITNKTNKNITVLTSIFGNYDMLREPLIIYPNVDYICITDNSNLKSNNWNIIVNPINIDSTWSARKKTYYVRYHPFEFCKFDSDYCFWVDASIQLNTFDFNYFAQKNSDIIGIYGQEIFDYCKKYIFEPLFSNKTINCPNDYKFLYISAVNFISVLNCMYKKYSISNNNLIHTILGTLRGYKNTKTVKTELLNIYQILTNTAIIKSDIFDLNYMNFHFNDIFYYDEPITGIILNNLSMTSIDFYDAFTKLTKFYKHNSLELRIE